MIFAAPKTVLTARLSRLTRQPDFPGRQTFFIGLGGIARPTPHLTYRKPAARTIKDLRASCPGQNAMDSGRFAMALRASPGLFSAVDGWKPGKSAAGAPGRGKDESMNPDSENPSARTLELGPDLSVIAVENGVRKNLGDIWAVRQAQPDIFAALTLDHFGACARKHPELKHAMEEFLTDNHEFDITKRV